ncbi:copper resistance CopC/CopD family protein [Pedococcus soli]
MIPLLRRSVVPAVVVALAMAVFAGAGPASAHAFLVSSNPADGQVLDSSPTVLRMRLSESVLLGSTSVTVVGGSVRHELTGLRLVETADGGAAAKDGADPLTRPRAAASSDEAPVELVAPLPALGRGSYRVSLETVSADDLHRTAAVLVFGIQQQVSAAGRQEAAPRVDEALLRWVVLAGLCLGLGAALVRRLATPARHGSVVRVARACDQVAAAACAVAALTAVGLLAVQLSGEGAAGLGTLFGAYGARWLTRETGLLLIGAAAVLRWRRLAPRTARLAVASGAVLATTGEALLGHAGAGVTTSWARVAATALHVGAAATWAGAAVLLTGCALVLRREGVPGRALARALLRRFGVPAAACVSVMVVTGVVLASSVVASVDALLVTDYGRVLLLKVAATAVALGLGLAHTRSLHPRLLVGRRRAATAAVTPGRSLVVEGVAAGAALALAALLAAGQPAVGPALVADPAAPFDPTVSAFADDLQEQLSIQPNRPGPNVAVITVSSTRRPDPAPVTGVTVAVYSKNGGLRSAGTGERSALGQWSVPVTMTEAGAADAVVTVTRVGVPPTELAVDWVVAQAVPPRPVVSLAPLRGWLLAVACVLAALLASAWSVAGLRRWRGRSRRRTGPAVEWSEVPAGARATRTWAAATALAPDQDPGAQPDRSGLPVPSR